MIKLEAKLVYFIDYKAKLKFVLQRGLSMINRSLYFWSAGPGRLWHCLRQVNVSPAINYPACISSNLQGSYEFFLVFDDCDKKISGLKLGIAFRHNENLAPEYGDDVAVRRKLDLAYVPARG